MTPEAPPGIARVCPPGPDARRPFSSTTRSIDFSRWFAGTALQRERVERGRLIGPPLAYRRAASSLNNRVNQPWMPFQTSNSFNFIDASMT